MRFRSCLGALALVLLSGCTISQIQQASAAYEDAFVPLENIGRFDRWRQKAPPARLLQDGHPDSLVELGRRSETGEGGMPKDRTCAAYWYQRAFGTPYDEQTSTYAGGMVIDTGKVRRAGLPQARVALRKLMKAGGVEHITMGDADARCGSVPLALTG
jgi:hypothetical protein